MSVDDLKLLFAFIGLSIFYILLGIYMWHISKGE